MSDRQRLENGLPIRRPRRKQQLQNDCRLRKCIAKYDNGEYTQMQFLRAVSHSVMHAQPLQIQDDSSDDNTADNAETEIDNATTSTAGSAESAVSVVASSDPDIVVKCACFNRAKVWLWCHAGMLVSVPIAQTLSQRRIADARYAARPFVWCCVCIRKLTLRGQRLREK